MVIVLLTLGMVQVAMETGETGVVVVVEPLKEDRDIGTIRPSRRTGDANATPSPKIEVKPRCDRLSQINSGKWNEDMTSFEPTGCVVERLSRLEVKRCLAGRSIAFVGDSLVQHGRDPRGVGNTTAYEDTHKILVRFYSMWKAMMFNSTGYGSSVDNHETSIRGILLNQTIDLVVMNLGAHHQFPRIVTDPRGLPALDSFFLQLTALYREPGTLTPVPLLWLSVNPQVPAKKPPKERFQTNRLSRILNEFAQWHFEAETETEAEAEPEGRRIPMLDFTSLIEQGLPASSQDGIHNTIEIDAIKVQIILNFVCGPNGFTTHFRQ